MIKFFVNNNQFYWNNVAYNYNNKIKMIDSENKYKVEVSLDDKLIDVFERFAEAKKSEQKFLENLKSKK